MICRLFVAAFFSLLNIGTVYPILYLHKKAPEPAQKPAPAPPGPPKTG